MYLLFSCISLLFGYAFLSVYSWWPSTPPTCIFYNASICFFNERCHFSHQGPSLADQVQQLQVELTSLCEIILSLPPPSLHNPLSSTSVCRGADTTAPPPSIMPPTSESVAGADLIPPVRRLLRVSKLSKKTQILFQQEG